MTLEIHHGKRKTAPRLVIYGQPGVGKSSLAAAMSKPVFVDFDRGLAQLNVDSLDAPKTWAETLSALAELGKSSAYETIVIDTIDGLEEQAIGAVCLAGKKNTLAQFDWGGGYEALANEWRVMLSTLERSNKNICMLAHSAVRTAQDPTLGSYDQYTPQLQKKVWSATHRWADLIGFAAFDAAIVGDERRAIVTGERVLHTTKGSGFEAKNRFSMPPKLPLSWSIISSAMMSPDEIRSEILRLAGKPREEKAKAAIADAGENLVRLIQILEEVKK